MSTHSLVADLSTVNALSFDADQTLWDYTGVQKLALQATVREIERRGDVAKGVATAEVLQSVRSEVVKGFRGTAHNLEDVRRESFRVFLDRHGHHDPAAAAAELAEVFLTVRFNSIRLYDEVEACLARLKSKYALGLLTNGNTYPERCGLPGVFDAVVIGPTHGFEKPDRRAFEMIASELGVELASTLHVGDDYDDVIGANDAGAISVFMNRDGADPDFRNEADFEVANLIELERLLAAP